MSQRTRQKRDQHRRRRRISLQVVAAIGAVLLLVVIGVLALGSTDSEDPPTSGTTVSMTEFAFSPDPIVLEAADATLTVVNDGAVAHNILVNELGKGSPNVEPGEEFTLDLSDQPAGTYAVVCDITGHTEAGMTTELTIK